MRELDTSLLHVLLVLILLITLSSSLECAVESDNTASKTDVKLEGSTYFISGGSSDPEGKNLFHSFHEFSIPAGSTVEFEPDSSLNSVDNILARVTGGGISRINGEIKTTGFPVANFFLLNPAGVIMGPGSSLDLGGDFHVSTADYVRFSDDELFYTRSDNLGGNNINAVISGEAIKSFGFLSDNPASVRLDFSESGAIKERIFSLNPESVFSITSGEIVLDNSIVQSTGGKIVLTSIGEVKGAVEVLFNDTSGVTLVEGDASLGKILISSNSNQIPALTVSNTNELGSGNIIINAANLELNNSLIRAATKDGTGNQTGVVLDVSDRLELTDSKIELSTSGEGGSGNLKINSAKIELNNSTLRTSSTAGGASGSIGITADALFVYDGSSVLSNSSGDGRAGIITINANELVMISSDNGEPSKISASSSGSFANGKISIAGDADLKIMNGGFIQGTCNINCSTNAKATDINITAGSVSLTSSGRIINNTNGQGEGGSISITASDFIDVAGMNDPELDQTGIFSENKGASQKGGSITLFSPMIKITNGARVSALTTGSGEGGSIGISSENGKIKITDAEVSAKSKFLTSDSDLGSSGDILLKAPEISLNGNGSVNVTTEGLNAGKITVQTDGLLRLQGNSAISTSAQAGSGGGGNIDIFGIGKNNLVLLQDNAFINAQAKNGQGGNIVVTAQSVLGATKDNVNAENQNSVEGRDGLVVFKTPDVDATTGTLELPQTFFDASNLIASRCNSNSEGTSSLYVGERGGLGTSPDFLLSGSFDDEENAHYLEGSGQQMVFSNTYFTEPPVKIICSR